MVKFTGALIISFATLPHGTAGDCGSGDPEHLRDTRVAEHRRGFERVQLSLR